MVHLARYAAMAATAFAVSSLSGCVTITHTGSGKISVNSFGVFSSSPGNTASESVQKALVAAKVTTLKIDNDAGSIYIEPSSGDEIHLIATKTLHGSDAPDALKALLPKVNVQAVLTDGTLVVGETHPDDFGTRQIGVAVDYKITMPPRLASQLTSNSGSIKMRGISGAAVLHCAYGGIDVKDAGGDLNVSTTSGAVIIENAHGAKHITAKDDYGNIQLKHVAGDISADTTSGALTVADAHGATRIKLHSGYGSVRVTSASGSIDASSSSGAVNVSDSRVEDVLTLRSDYGGVEATGITASSSTLKVSLSTSSGTAKYNGEATELKLSSDYGSADCELGSALILHSAQVASSSGTVSLTLPSAVSANVKAITNSGSITLPGTPSQPSNGESSSRTMTMGGGAAPVTLKSEYGSVTLRLK